MQGVGNVHRTPFRPQMRAKLETATVPFHTW